jgi:hypothetical protein
MPNVVCLSLLEWKQMESYGFFTMNRNVLLDVFMEEVLRVSLHQQKNHMSSITSGSSSSNGSNGCFLNLWKQIVVDLVIPGANLF